MCDNLRFADDIVIASENLEELQTMLEQLNVESKAVGPEMNRLKTQVMFNNHIDENNQNIMIDGFQLNLVTLYTYLGQLVSTYSNTEHKVKGRIGFC